jgi:16S rRNA (cytosine1402-N4)-methyltransferase
MITQDTIHQPVLVDQVISIFNPQVGQRYIDATIGGGGHTARLLNNGVTVLGFDQDADAIAATSQRFNGIDNLTLVHANFITLQTKAIELGFDQVDGILFDLGLSSLQLDSPKRGFSFTHDAPLDMRMNQTSQPTAADLVNNMAEDELYELLITNAQESKARPIAQAIVAQRPLTTTLQLANLVSAVYGGRQSHLHPATKTFQALRIAVNQELKLITPSLKAAVSLLKIGGKLLVISFHEGEDRLVKRTFLEMVESGIAVQPGRQPQIPQRQEVLANPRARSAKLRFIERIV